MLNIGIAGCSHSGYSYGNPWSYYMSQNLGAQIIDVSASGVGNEMMIEKMIIEEEALFQELVV